MSKAVNKSPEIIVAYDRNGLIGTGNQLPWQGRLPGDMRHFRETTIGHRVVMGRRTYESIGHPLVARENFVLSNDESFTAEGCSVINDPELATEFEEEDDRKLFVIGGDKIFRIYLPLASIILATEIDYGFEGDVYFKKPSSDIWEQTSQLDYEIDQLNEYGYSIVKYERTRT